MTAAGGVVPTRFELVLPAWVPPWLADRPGPRTTDEDQMELVLDLAAEHVERGTGGPFAAGVFEQGTGRLLAVGVNLVVSASACIAHAEVVAFAFAGQVLRTFDLGATSAAALVTSTEPCAMCLGAVAWSGVTRVVCGARDEDARAIGFDEGLKPPGWEANLASLGIEVVRDVHRDAGRAVLDRYAELDGDVYNCGDRRA